tara:strand:- start:73 stop:363 length:291 start_codon:yes stop_codon:yes gene_type:complete
MDKENFNKKKIIKGIYKKLGFSKNYSSKILDDFFEILVTELINSEKIKITSFGTFKVNNKKERIGRNPKTKIETMISARKVIKFKPSLELKNKINR